MTNSQHTNEFSVILLLDKTSKDKIEDIRTSMPASPYRDDWPHLTLLQGCHTPRSMSDVELYNILCPILNRLLKPKLHATVAGLSNLFGGYYKDTSSIILSTSNDLQREHISLLSSLRGSHFKVDRKESIYRPHVTIRLGVPMNQGSLQLANELFPEGKSIRFDKWEIYRLISSRGKRQFYKVLSSAV